MSFFSAGRDFEPVEQLVVAAVPYRADRGN
jgi:hypothetical protein